MGRQLGQLSQVAAFRRSRRAVRPGFRFGLGIFLSRDVDDLALWFVGLGCFFFLFKALLLLGGRLSQQAAGCPRAERHEAQHHNSQASSRSQ
jgi:hypothetical protein